MSDHATIAPDFITDRQLRDYCRRLLPPEMKAYIKKYIKGQYVALHLRVLFTLMASMEALKSGPPCSQKEALAIVAELTPFLSHDDPFTNYILGTLMGLSLDASEDDELRTIAAQAIDRIAEQTRK